MAHGIDDPSVAGNAFKGNLVCIVKLLILLYHIDVINVFLIKQKQSICSRK